MRGALGQFGRRRWTQAWGQVGRSNKDPPALCFRFVLACCTLFSSLHKAEQSSRLIANAAFLLFLSIPTQTIVFVLQSEGRSFCFSVYQEVKFAALIITTLFSFTLCQSNLSRHPGDLSTLFYFLILVQ